MSPDPCPAAHTVPATVKSQSITPSGIPVLSFGRGTHGFVSLGFFLWTFLCDLCVSALSSPFVRRLVKFATQPANSRSLQAQRGIRLQAAGANLVRSAPIVAPPGK